VIVTTTTTKRPLPGCLGAIILSVAFFGTAALIGYPDLIGQAPVLSTMVLTINFTVPMVAWMSFRHRQRRPTLEMAGASIGLGIVLIGMGLLGLIPMSDIFGWEATLCCPTMLVPMLFRAHLYTGSMDRQAHAA
jgi:hypothetical protein